MVQRARREVYCPRGAAIPTIIGETFKYIPDLFRDMPHIPIAENRVRYIDETLEYDEVTVDVEVFAEEYRHQSSYIRGLLGYPKTYERRLIVLDIGGTTFTSRADPDETSYEEQVDELMDEVRESRNHNRELVEKVRST